MTLHSENGETLLPSAGSTGPRDRTFDRVVRVLDLLADAPLEGIGVRSSAEAAGLSKSAVQRILQSLRELGVAEQLKTGKYVAGARLERWAAASVQRSVSIEIADRVMQEAVRKFDETFYLTRYLPVPREAAIVHSVESERPLRYVLPVGLRLPLHAGAAGKAILAYLPDEVVDELALPSFTDNTIVSTPELKAELRLIRDRGFAMSRGERMDGAAGIAAAYTKNGIIAGSVTMTVRLVDVDHNRLAELGNAAIDVARRISIP